MRVWGFLLWSVIAAVQTAAQVTAEVHVLCIANAHYVKDPAKLARGFPGLSNVSPAVESARRFGAILKEGGSVTYDTLFSTEQMPLTRTMMLSKIGSWAAMIKNRPERKKLAVLYYCGHGFSDSTSLALHLPTGNTLRDPWGYSTQEWDSLAVPLQAIRDTLSMAKLKNLVFMDCCYEGRPIAGDRVSHMSEFHDAMKDIPAMMQNAMRLMGYPLIRACKPGKQTSVVLHEFENGKRRVGPLCARLDALLRGPLATDKTITLKQFMRAYMDGKLANHLPRPHSGWQSIDSPYQDNYENYVLWHR